MESAGRRVDFDMGYGLYPIRGRSMDELWIQKLRLHHVGTDSMNNRKHSLGAYYEILFAEHADGLILLNDTLYRLETGCVYCIPPHCLHCTMPADASAYVRSKIVFSDPQTERLLQTCGAGWTLDSLRANPVLRPDAERCALLTTLFEEGEAICAHYDHLRDMRIASLLLRMLACLCEMLPAADMVQNDRDPLLTAILFYINDCLETSLSLDEIAGHCHISKYYLCRFFKEKTGMTIMQYIARKRILTARAALLETEKPVSVIAMECGYDSASHFCRAFRESEGITPAAFRRQNVKKNE